MNYEKQANDFAKKHGIKLTILDSEYKKHFHTDREYRWVFKCKLTRNRKSYTFYFGQSIASSDDEPTMYDILSCFEKYDPETFENFCSQYGYDNDSISAHKTYKAVVKEYKAVERLFGDIIEELQEIQ